jgi:hypothetical protein
MSGRKQERRKLETEADGPHQRGRERRMEKRKKLQRKKVKSAGRRRDREPRMEKAMSESTPIVTDAAGPPRTGSNPGQGDGATRSPRANAL